MNQYLAPPWAAEMQARANRAQADLDTRAVARDIVNGVMEDIVSPRPATHRKEQS